MNYRISESQAFANNRGDVLQLMDEAPALALRRGDWLAVRRANRYVCDALYVLVSGEVVRMQGLPDGIHLTRGDGSQEIIIVDETLTMVVGYVVEKLVEKSRLVPTD